MITVIIVSGLFSHSHSFSQSLFSHYFLNSGMKAYNRINDNLEDYFSLIFSFIPHLLSLDLKEVIVDVIDSSLVGLGSGIIL